MNAVQPCQLPQASLLLRYRSGKAYADCYVTEVPGDVLQPVFVKAFYTTPLFKLERFGSDMSQDGSHGTAAASDYLVVSRGIWDAGQTPEPIQAAIDHCCVWYEGALAEGRMKPGQRLARGGRLVSRAGAVDGPFSETREVVGGYWFIVAHGLDEAVARAASGKDCQLYSRTQRARVH